jgi:hypothetical protein
MLTVSHVICCGLLLQCCVRAAFLRGAWCHIYPASCPLYGRAGVATILNFAVFESSMFGVDMFSSNVRPHQFDASFTLGVVVIVVVVVVVVVVDLAVAFGGFFWVLFP